MPTASREGTWGARHTVLHLDVGNVRAKHPQVGNDLGQLGVKRPWPLRSPDMLTSMIVSMTVGM
jgi:hypothetical protein